MSAFSPGTVRSSNTRTRRDRRRSSSSNWSTRSPSVRAAGPALAWSLVRRLIEAADIAPRLSVSVPDETLIPEDLLENADINSADIDWQLSELPLSANLLSGEFAAASQSTNSGSWLSTAALFVLAVVLGFGYLQVSNAQLEESVTNLEKQVSSGFGNVFAGKKAAPEKIRASGESLLENLFKQRESSQAPAMKVLVELGRFMTACNCDLESLSVTRNGVKLELKNADKLTLSNLKIAGYKVSSKKIGEITSISLLEVEKS